MTLDPHSPRRYLGVTVSSTFADLEDHRAALIKAIKAHGLTDVAMENDAAKLLDVVDSSLQMVRDGSAYIGIISKKYGQIPKCARRNPDNLSITELEFNEAIEQRRPILLFIMGKDHLVYADHVETNATKRKKLKRFTERAKQITPDSPVHRVYATFDSLEDFKDKVGPSIAELRRQLDKSSEPPGTTPGGGSTSADPDPIPKAPAFYAEPAYIGSHTFTGRRAQLDVLDDWARPADPHTVLLFEAIGGNGKSMLTWEWTNKHATKVRTDWAGRFWYSFYERGAIMADFCQRALAYVTGQPLAAFRKKKTTELSKLLLHHLQLRPWLFILDGLERVLVAYHRIDAAEVPDEDANNPTDKIVSRDPCAAIRPEDDELLRTLASAAPSKLLVTSRLVPRVLLNAANQPIPGVQRIALPGLRPPDAESLLRSCDVTGDSGAIQHYLTSHCDCHPLVIGVLAGLINDYFADRGNFNTWAADPTGGGQLNLANLDLIQKRNHILKAGLDALPEKSRQLLSTLALLSESVDYPTLSAFNPHLPPELEKVDKPENPERSSRWKAMPDADKTKAVQEYQVTLQRRKEYEHAIEARLQSPEFLTAPQELAKTVRDLERRGLLQYDRSAKRYDLHPVVRGVASGGLRAAERDQYGQRVVDHFSQQPHNPYEEAVTLDDLRDGLHVVRTLLKMGRFNEASQTFRGSLANAILFNLAARAEILSLLRPFFPKGWGTLPSDVVKNSGSYLAHVAAMCLGSAGELEQALITYGIGLIADLESADWRGIGASLCEIYYILCQQNLLIKADRILLMQSEVAILSNDTQRIFLNRLDHFWKYSSMGQWAEADAVWLLLDPMGRNWGRAVYRPGDAEYQFAQAHFWKGDLQEEHLANAERLATEGKNRMIVQYLHRLRGEWRMEQGQWPLAAESLHDAVRMARAVGQVNASAETQLVLARFHVGQLTDPRREAEQLAQARYIAPQPLGELWLAIGDREQAKKHALTAYDLAWGDGEPYVYRYGLNKATALLTQLGTEIPKLPPYDPAKDEKFPWEDAVVAAIEKLRAEKEAEKNKKS
jgi:hypothetical protein